MMAFSIQLTFPEKSWREWLIAGLVFGSSALHFSFFFSYTQLIGDEGIVLQGAQRILEGQILYRDFFSFLTPGSFYWNALFLKIFGNSILVARTVLLVEGALLSTITYLLARRVCARWTSFLAALSVTLTSLPHWFLVLHNWDSTLWASLALYCAVLFLQSPRHLSVLAIGWFVVLTCMFEQSKGAGIVVGLALAFAIIAATDPAMVRYWKPFRTTLVVGLILPFLAAFLYFAVNHSSLQMAAGWFWPLRHYSEINKTAYGFVAPVSALGRIYSGPWDSRLVAIIVTAPWFIIPALPLISVASLTHGILKRWRGTSHGPGGAYHVLVSSTVIGSLLSLVATGRPDFTHLLYLSPIVFITVAWLIDGQMPARPAFRVIQPLLTVVILLSCFAFGMALLSKPLSASRIVNTRRGTLKAARADEIIEYIQQNVSAGELILVYPDQPLYYYLTATSNPTSYEYLIPGFHTAEQYQAFVKAFDERKPRLVFLEPSYRERLSAGNLNLSARLLTERDVVAEYIGAHYQACADLTAQNGQHFLAMVRDDLSCPER